MAIAKKGLRIIVVEGKTFSWKFNEKVFVTSEEDGLLVVDFGWYDVWLYVNKVEKPPEFTPAIATPGFVRQAILFAISEGWQAQQMEMQFRNGTFRMIEN